MYILKVYLIHYSLRQNKSVKQKFPLDKKNSTKHALFFLLWAPTHHGFTFNLWFLCELKHKVCLSKTACGIFPFLIQFGFYWSLHFCLPKCKDSGLQNVVAPFKIKVIEKPHRVLLPDLWFLNCSRNFMNSTWSSTLPKNYLETNFVN